MSIKEQEIEDICYSSNYSGLEKEKKLKRLIKKTKEQILKDIKKIIIFAEYLPNTEIIKKLKQLKKKLK